MTCNCGDPNGRDGECPEHGREESTTRVVLTVRVMFEDLADAQQAAADIEKGISGALAIESSIEEL